MIDVCFTCSFLFCVDVAVRRSVSTSTIISSPATPTNEISHLAIATPPPTPPTSLLSLHARARALLCSTCNNTSAEIAGRDDERATIHNFLSSFLDSSAIETDDVPSTSLYISGKVTNLGLQARLVILCALLASKRLEAGLTISSTTSASPTKKSPTSPMKRSSSLPNPSANVNRVGIDANQLHTYYSSILNRSDGGVLELVSRSKFGIW